MSAFPDPVPACCSHSPVSHDGSVKARPSLLCIGGEDHALRIPFLLALRDKGFEVSAAGSGSGKPFEQAGIEHHELTLARFLDPLSDRETLRRLQELLARRRPDIVQCFDTKLNILVPLAARRVGGIETVGTINGLGWLYSSRSLPALALRPVFQALQTWAERHTRLTVFQNRDDLAFFRRRRMVRPDRGRLIPGSGVDIGRYGACEDRTAAVTELRRTLRIGEAPVVATVSRLTREKGIPTLLRAAALVHAAVPAAKILLIGPKDNEGSSAVAASEIERHAPYVEAIGLRKDIPDLLAMADVFVCPTELREGVPRVLLEAAAAGRPIVATAVPGCTDVVRHGWDGLLVPPRAPRRLADAIVALLEDRAQAALLGRRAAEHARSEFSLDITVDRYVAVYREVLSGAPGALPAAHGTRAPVVHAQATAQRPS